MSAPDFDAAAYMAAVSRLLDLSIAPAHEEGVIAFLRIAESMADILEAVPLDARELALAPVFTLPDRG
ncbi:DUF4089 domain-containing protein [Acuticoccus kandeliae]|uniref:DUF4089 domain-containing protein n=1 Tax=Acuticoccus kandeliae TaxID=2073160 RepID=UPI000D3E3444|nr:DUF4089 domain-containing protein [Acuticoccus kandeliae]